MHSHRGAALFHKSFTFKTRCGRCCQCRPAGSVDNTVCAVYLYTGGSDEIERLTRTILFAFTILGAFFSVLRTFLLLRFPGLDLAQDSVNLALLILRPIYRRAPGRLQLRISQLVYPLQVHLSIRTTSARLS